MAIRIFCDICQVEIKNNERQGSFLFVEKGVSLQTGQPSIRKVELMFCKNCADKIMNFLNEIKSIKK